MANKFLNGIKVSSSAVVNGESLSTGSTILDIQGSQGQLFSVTNSLTGDLFAVSDISGIPILNVNSNGLINIDGKLGINNDTPAYGLDIDLDSVNDRINITAGGAQKAIINGYGNIIAYGSLTSYSNTLGGGGGIFTYKGGTATQTIGHRFQHVSGNFTGSSGDQTMMQINPTINQTSSAGYTGIKLNVTETATGSGTKNLLDLQVGGTSKASISSAGNATFAGDIDVNSFVEIGADGTYPTNYGAVGFGGRTNGYPRVFGGLTNKHIYITSGTGGDIKFRVNGASTNVLDIESDGNATFAGTIGATNFSGSSSGTNTGDQDLSGYSTTSHNHDGRYLRTHSRHSDDLDTITTSGVYIWDVSEADDEPTGAADGLLTIKYWDSTNWATASFQDFHNNKLYIKSKQSNTWQTDWAQVWTTDQLTTTNKTNYDTAYAHSQATHAPTDAEANVQSDWNATSGDALILNKPTIPTDFVSAANGGTFGGNVTIKHASSPNLILTDDSPDPDNVGKIQVANTYMDFSLDSTDVTASSRMRFRLDGANIVEILPNTTYFRQTNIHLQNTAVSNINFRKDAAITAGDDIGKINFGATNDEVATFPTGGNIIYEGDGTWDLSSINNAPTRMKIQLRNSSGALQNAMMLSSNLNANFYGDLTVAGDLIVSGTTTTLNTATVEVEDNILQLNTTQAATDTATASTSGISIYRGVDGSNVAITQASLIFDEADDTWDLTNNLTVAGDVIGASFAVPSGASTGFLKADGSVDSTSYSGYTFGSTDLTFSGTDPGDIVWRNGDGDEVHRIWSGSNDYLTYRNDAGTAYELISAGSTSYNNTDWDTAYTHSQAAHAPSNAEQNVQADWNETTTTSDAFILNKLTDYVSAASGGTFSGDLAINADLTINGSTDNNGAVTPRTLDFTTNPTNAGLAGSSGYQIGEISFTGKDSSTNAAGKYGRIRGSIVDSNTTVQGSGGEGGKLQFTLLKHDVGAQPRVEYDILTLTPLVAEVDGQLEVSGNIQLTGGGIIEAPSSNGAENLILKAAGGVDVIIDSNGNGGDNEIFRVMHHTSAVLFEVQEGGEVRFQDGIRISGTEDRISSVGSSMYIGGGGFGNSLVQFSGKPIPDSSYAFDFGASNRYWNQCYLGTIHLKSALLSNQENTDIDSAAAEVVASVAHATYTAAFFDFVIKKGTNIKSGTVFACHDGTNVEFTETSTADLGDTSDVTLSVDISGADMRLLATVTSDDWSVKSLIRAI